MRIAYLDCFSGISGDMFLGALVDAGVPVSLLEETLTGLGIGARLSVSKVDRSGITATKVDVLVDGEPDRPREATWDAPQQENLKAQSSPRGAAKDAKVSLETSAQVTGVQEKKASGLGAHAHEHLHGDERAHSHSRSESHNEEPAHSHSHLPSDEEEAAHSCSHSHSHTHAHADDLSRARVHGRHLTEIKRIIGAAPITARAKSKAIAIFEALGAAEAKIHNVDIERVHFHEVGAVDAMVDIVGAAVGAEALGVDEIVCSPLNVGGGTVKCAHGVFPVPAPATVELLKGAPVFSTGVQAELVTPTGAAIVRTLAARFAAFPAMKIEKTGYGAGTKDFAGHANVVRLTIGEVESVDATARTQDAASRVSTESAAHAIAVGHAARETITVLEANLDDLNPQVIGYVMDRLLAEGALDAFGVPVQMKKSRPGTLLTALCRPEDAAKLTGILFAETTTLGVRRRDEQRQVLTRRWESVSTEWGEVRVKIASMNGTVMNCAPEYEDCKRIAEEKRIPLKSVMLEALQAYMLGAASKKH